MNKLEPRWGCGIACPPTWTETTLSQVATFQKTRSRSEWQYGVLSLKGLFKPRNAPLKGQYMYILVCQSHCLLLTVWWKTRRIHVFSMLIGSFFLANNKHDFSFFYPQGCNYRCKRKWGERTWNGMSYIVLPVFFDLWFVLFWQQSSLTQMRTLPIFLEYFGFYFVKCFPENWIILTQFRFPNLTPIVFKHSEMRIILHFRSPRRHSLHEW